VKTKQASCAGSGARTDLRIMCRLPWSCPAGLSLRPLVFRDYPLEKTDPRAFIICGIRIRGECQGDSKTAGGAPTMNMEPELPEIEWAVNFAALDDDRLRAYLSTLPVRQQVDALLSLEWEDRIRLIKNSPAPKELVSRIPDEEVLLTMKGMGEEDTLELIALSSPTQLQFLLDVELWSRDSVSEDKVIQWLEYLIGCGEEKVIEFVQTADRDLLVLLLVRLVYLIPNETDVPIPAGVTNIMQDEYFTILAGIPKETENIKLLLRVMRQWDRDAFYSLLFEAYGSAGPETEERAFRWRNSRLEEKGLLEFEEAIEIYGYIGEEEARLLADVREAVPLFSESVEAPSYPARLAGAGTFFSRVLTSIAERDMQNRLRGEIAFAANRLLIADAGEIGDLESMRRALDRLFSLVNVGMLFLSGEDAQQAREILMRLSIKDLFQIGVSRALDLKSRAAAAVRKWWPGWRERGFTFLPFPEDGVMNGLMQRVPQYYALGSSGEVDFRDFESMDEVKRTGEILAEIVAAADTCFGDLAIPAPAGADLESNEVFVAGLEEIDLRNLLATGFVNFVLRGAFDITPLERAGIKTVFESKPEGTKAVEWRLRREAVSRFLAWLEERSGREGEAWLPLERFAAKALANLEDELKKIRSWSDLDPRYVRSVILRRESGEDARG
jgi:hypothetical protein